MPRTGPPGGSASRAGVVRDCLGVGFAVGLYGAAFGAAGTAAGLTTAQTCVLSLVMFTGASQFALVGVLGAGGAAPVAVAGALMLGARNTLYAVRLAPLVTPARRGAGRSTRLGAAHLVIDESTAMAVGAPAPWQRLAFFTTGLAVFVGWNLTTLAGALGADLLAAPVAAAALDAVVPAAFLALLWPRLRASAAERRVAAGGALIALLLTPVLPAGAQVIAAAAAVGLGLGRHRRPGERR